MDSGNIVRDGSTSKAGSNKRGTPNKRWKADFDNFLIPILVEQARRGLKCDKSFKRAAFSHAASTVNAKFGTDFNAENVENHYRTLKARYVEIKKARELSGAGWDDDLKMITLDPIVAVTYTEAHPGAKAFINRPIDNYEGLRVICGEDNATGSYATSLYSEFGVNTENYESNNENVERHAVEDISEEEGNGTPIPPVSSSPATSSNGRSSRSNRKPRAGGAMSDLVSVVSEIADAIRSPQQPQHWTEILYARIMEVDGFEERELVEVLDYLQVREPEARGFMIRKVELRKEWIRGFLSRME